MENNRVKQIPRQDFVKPENWNASSDMPHPYSTPVVQTRHFTKDPKRKALTKARQQWVKRACLHTYEGYKKRKLYRLSVAPNRFVLSESPLASLQMPSGTTKSDQ